MNDRQIKYLLKLAETGSFSRTAEIFFVSQSTISSQIGQLEEELGFKLIQRGKKVCTLTDSGREYVDFIRASSKMHDAICRQIKETNSRTAPHLSIGLTEHFYLREFNQAIEYIMSSNAGLHVKIEVLSLMQLQAGLRDNSFDIIIVPRGLLSGSDVSKMDILTLEFVIMYPKGCGLIKNREPKLEDFTAKPLFVAGVKSDEFPALLSQLIAQYASSNLPSPQIVSVPNDHSVVAAVRAGMGFGLDDILQPELLRGDLQAFHTGINFQMSAIYLKDSPNPTIKAFLDTLTFCL